MTDVSTSLALTRQHQPAPESLPAAQLQMQQAYEAAHRAKWFTKITEAVRLHGANNGESFTFSFQRDGLTIKCVSYTDASLEIFVTKGIYADIKVMSDRTPGAERLIAGRYDANGNWQAHEWPEVLEAEIAARDAAANATQRKQERTAEVALLHETTAVL